MDLRSLRCETRKPKLSSGSLAIRSSPHSAFSSAIRRMRRRSSTGIGGHRRLDLYRPNRRQPARCQRIIVSGRTTTRVSRQPNCRESDPRGSRAGASTRLGPTPRSWNRIRTRWRNRFSASIDRRCLTESAPRPTRLNNGRTTISRKTIALVIMLNRSRTRQPCEAV